MKTYSKIIFFPLVLAIAAWFINFSILTFSGPIIIGVLGRLFIKEYNKTLILGFLLGFFYFIWNIVIFRLQVILSPEMTIPTDDFISGAIIMLMLSGLLGMLGAFLTSKFKPSK